MGGQTERAGRREHRRASVLNKIEFLMGFRRIFFGQTIYAKHKHFVCVCACVFNVLSRQTLRHIYYTESYIL